MECRICNSIISNNYYEVYDLMFGLGDKFAYIQCTKCDCLQIVDIPIDMSKYYPPTYYSFKSIKYNNALVAYLKKIRNSYAIFNEGLIGRCLYKLIPNETLRSWFYGINTTNKTRVIDVGCGSGSLLYELSRSGLVNLLGIDPYIKKDIVYNHNLIIRKQYIYEVEGDWDIIMFHHSFEHIPDPVETIENVSRLLSPGGLCLLRIPTVSSFAWEHYRENWVQIDAPRHFYLHSIKSIKMLAEKFNLDLEKVVYDSWSFQFWGSEQYIRGIPRKSEQSYGINRAKSIFSKADIKGFEENARKLNSESRGDQAAFYLRKRKDTVR